MLDYGGRYYNPVGLGVREDLTSTDVQLMLDVCDTVIHWLNGEGDPPLKIKRVLQRQDRYLNPERAVR
jgi:hypothetical protein